ncbi:MAG: hypothetical protein EOO96_10160 [Pedobacter sp.]|nr:MAG: hypothetical protein EOO96_10160 [Pedobacter sp.]
MNIALITYKDNGLYTSPTIENEDDTLLKFLEAKGLNIEKVIWNDPTVNWENYQLAILKSPWDYFDLVDDFYEWLAMIKQKNIKLLNPVDVVKWNADKHYLQDIKNAGLNVTPSRFLTKGDEINFDSYFEEFKTEKLIVKPAVSGGSKNTFKITSINSSEIAEKIIELVTNENFIVQPFLKEIEENGEWSFLFFGGKFSHALLKKAKPGDFRVQHSFGGTIHPQEAPADLLIEAKKYVDQFAKNCLYARVDGAVVNNKFMLMELELIEPFLFLNEHEDALENYFEALTKLM